MNWWKFTTIRISSIWTLVCSYHCATQPSYLLNIFELKEECFFTKLTCFMWVRDEENRRISCWICWFFFLNSFLSWLNIHENVELLALFLLEQRTAKYERNWFSPTRPTTIRSQLVELNLINELKFISNELVDPFLNCCSATRDLCKAAVIDQLISSELNQSASSSIELLRTVEFELSWV